MSENGPCTCPKCHKLYWCHLPHPNMCDDCWKKEQMSEPVKTELLDLDELNIKIGRIKAAYDRIEAIFDPTKDQNKPITRFNL